MLGGQNVTKGKKKKKNPSHYAPDSQQSRLDAEGLSLKKDDLSYGFIVPMLHSSDAVKVGDTTFPFYFRLVLLLSCDLSLFTHWTLFVLTALNFDPAQKILHFT